ncbi:MAG: hypothetical protein K6T85_12365 [Gorillibacterium sp.]|nr:hypothetical protein [Gorillibacterium sp.]
MDMIDLSSAWDSAGPIFIGIIVVIIVAVLCLIVMAMIPKGLGKQLFAVLSPFILVGSFAWAVQIAAGIWANR